LCLGAAPLPLGPYRVELPTVILLPAGPGPGEERTLSPGDSILVGRIGLASAAILSAPIDIVVAGERVRARAGAVLMGVHARGGALANLRDPRIFCQQPYVPARHYGPGYERPGNDLRFPYTIQACFVDRDGDSRLDFAFMAGTGWPEDRAAVPLPQIPYQLRTDISFGDDTQVRLVYVQAALFSAAKLNMQILSGDENVGLTRVRLLGDDGRPHWTDGSQTLSGSSYPRTIGFGQAQVEVLAYDAQARSARVRLVRGFQRSEIVIEAVRGTGVTAFRN
jgi:hypothetical protein